MFYITYYQILIKNAPFPPNQPPTSTTLLQQHVSNQTNTTNNTFQTARFKHLYYTPRNAPSFRFQPPPSGTWFSAITPLPPVILLHLVLSHYTFTPGPPPSTGAQPLHSYRRSSSFNWCSTITPLPPVILLQLVLRTGKRVYRDQSLFVCSEISDEAIIV